MPTKATAGIKAAPQVKVNAGPWQAADLSGREDQILYSALRRFVDESKLSRPRIAQLMGVGVGTLNAWLMGTRKAHRMKLLELESFLRWHAPKYLNGSIKV